VTSALLERPRSAPDGPLPCREDPELWFADSPSDVELAKALCLRCPLQTECLAGALRRAEPWGVWGGQLVVRGVVVPHKRPRGRPRKHERTEVIPSRPTRPGRPRRVA
jgi:WhiB family transcriptional regulator, redox-sensing transcriptional regulator